MNRIKIHIGIISLLAIGLLSFYMKKDDLKDYKNVLFADKQIHISNGILVRSTDYQIRELESISEKYSSIKPLIKQTKQIQQIRGELYTNISEIKSKIFELENEYYTLSEEDGLEWNEKSNYPQINNSKKEVQLIIKNFAHELSDAYLNFDSSLINLLKDTTDISTFQQQRLTVFQNKNINIRDSSLNILRHFENEKILINTLSNFDLLHCLLFFESAKQELILMENKLIHSYYEFAELLKTPFKKPNKYAVIMLTDKLPIVGEQFKADFFIAAHINSDNLQMRVNGEEIPVKNGVGFYEFMPKRSGRFRYLIEVSYTNPITRKAQRYSQTYFVNVV